MGGKKKQKKHAFQSCFYKYTAKNVLGNITPKLVSELNCVAVFTNIQSQVICYHRNHLCFYLPGLDDKDLFGGG